MDNIHILELARRQQEDEGIIQTNNNANSSAIKFTSFFILILAVYKMYKQSYAFDLFAIVPFMNAIHRFIIYKERENKTALIVSLIYFLITVISLYAFFTIQAIK